MGPSSGSSGIASCVTRLCTPRRKETSRSAADLGGKEELLSELDHEGGKDLLCRVCRVVEYQFHHYGAYACNRCRAFFRRMVRRQRRGSPPTPCITTKSVPPERTLPICDISLFRGACQACRFLACLHQGMKPSLVLTDEARNSRYARSSIKTSLAKKVSSSKKKTTLTTTTRITLHANRLTMTTKKKKVTTTSSSVYSSTSNRRSFYFDSPVIDPPWIVDPEECIDASRSTVESPFIRVDDEDEEEEEDEGNSLLVVDDSDPIIGSVADIRGEIPTAREMWEGNNPLLLPSETDQFNLETLYRLMDEEHSSSQRGSGGGASERKPIMDRALQTPSSFEVALGTPPPCFDEHPSLEDHGNPLNFSFSVPEMDDSSLLVDILNN